MGHETVLVIGDNFMDQLDKYQRSEYAHPTNPHFVNIDRLDEAKKKFASATMRFLQHTDGSLHDPWDAQFWRQFGIGRERFVPIGFTEVDIPVQERMSFPDWVKKNYTNFTLPELQAPDLHGKHRLGWARVNSAGDVIELIERTIPGGFHDWFESTDDILKLKPGEEGLVITRAGEELAATSFAGSARKAAIDFEGMLRVLHDCAAERWDRAAAARGSQTWEPFNDIWKRYKTPIYSEKLRNAAAREWGQQTAVKAIIDACRIFPSSAIRVASRPTTAIINSSETEISHWEQMTSLERLAVGFIWNDHSWSGIDPLALPRDQYVQKFGLPHLLSYSKVIKDGMLLEGYDEFQLFESIAEDKIVTLVSVHS